jgi:hypothetical protein
MLNLTTPSPEKACAKKSVVVNNVPIVKKKFYGFKILKTV